MKFLQILMEVALFALSVIELIFVIQLNATVRVPMKITAILIVMIILFVLLVTFEFHESKKNREKTRKVKEDYERKIADLQKKIASEGGVIMDGRDIGTVIIPDAEVKVFLTATLEERARRRWKELIEKGENVTFEEVLTDMQLRDKNDSERETAPLKPADDAVIFVNDGYDAEGSADYIINLIRQRCRE